MQTKTEFLIWDKIVCSAKKRFDNTVYVNKLSGIDPEVYDKLVLHIILGFACGEDHNSISTNLHNELEHIGVKVREDSLDKVLADKHEVFNSEIYAAYIAFSMLENGASEHEVLGCVTDLLENPETT
ncbi:hypothetical protein [Sphingobacterium chungjuense]|jgi:hypothetical protein|uniref:hypothetical protein n=1 Tax=Sphingobacterium chungjuense TaxID=2675553 RepID=UPI00140D40D0|nr:hypothetical protein [Sphingobacterium chungjuense]